MVTCTLSSGALSGAAAAGIEAESTARTSRVETAAVPGAVTTEAQLRQAWSDPLRRRIDLGADIVLRDCRIGDPIRESPYSMVVDGHGHFIRRRASRSGCCGRTAPATW